MSEQPTQEQLEEFWEMYGFMWLPKGSRDKFKRLDAIEYPDGTIHSAYPPIDLNNLFKYAVPKVEGILGYEEYAKLMHRWIADVIMNQDPALALFWAL